MVFKDLFSKPRATNGAGVRWGRQPGPSHNPGDGSESNREAPPGHLEPAVERIYTFPGPSIVHY